MGTLVHIAVRAHMQAEVDRATDAAFAAIEQVERLMSFHSPDSELSRLNRSASTAPQKVHAWTYAVLRRAVRIAALSDGLFDVAVAPVLVEAGLLPHPPASPPWLGTWRDLMLLPDSAVLFRRPLLIDLGGIAKGFAVDQAVHALRRWGCIDATVNAGGDLRRFGPEPQVIHLRRAAGLVPFAELRCGAIATSEPNRPRPGRIAQPLGCIVDPRQRRPWRDAVSVTVAARSCVLADALTKVAALAGPACEPLLARFGARARWDPAA
jgi:thiamine biosynthesis lipoprotein